jgi:hypothetical protein
MNGSIATDGKQTIVICCGGSGYFSGKTGPTGRRHVEMNTTGM